MPETDAGCRMPDAGWAAQTHRGVFADSRPLAPGPYTATPPATGIRHPASGIQFFTGHRHPASGIQFFTGIRHPASGIRVF